MPTIISLDTHDPKGKAFCEAQSAVNRMFTAWDEETLYVYDCDKETARVPYSILHETGHLFGLCDQYGGSNNCFWGMPPVKGSVMQSAVSLELTPEDIEGVQVIASSYNMDTNLKPLKLLSGPYTAPQNNIFIDSKTSSLGDSILVTFSNGGVFEYKCHFENLCFNEGWSWLVVQSDKSVDLKVADGTILSFEKE
ncbi:MAG: hypothetical protein EOP04_02790 [Proteobacteria bacterium]|nr:MAG: hypothetical protein EOP04_02790 [Pseudomonadota bacterium]